MKKTANLLIIIGLILVIQTLSAQTWTSTKRITWTSGSSSEPAIAIDSNNYIHVVWMDNTPGNFEIYYKKSTNEGVNWTTERLTWTTRSPSEFCFAADSKDNLFVMWAEGVGFNGIHELFLKKSTDAGETWTTKRITWTAGYSRDPNITIDTSDNIHIVWVEDTPGNYEIYHKKSMNEGVNWTTKRLTWTGNDSLEPDITTDTSDHIHVVWDEGQSGYWSEMYYKKSTTGGTTWSGGKRLTWSPAGDAGGSEIATDSGNDIHYFWVDDAPTWDFNFRVLYKKSTDGGLIWSPTKRMTWGSESAGSAFIAIDSSDILNLVFSDKTPGNSEIFYKKSTDGGAAWTTTRLTWTSGGSGAPAIAVDSDDNLHVVWQDNTLGNAEIFYKKGIK